jgi:cellulose synthase/poly-beta-1,6-N-acetylglucosamine synthase-like glycosyltransferase
MAILAQIVGLLTLLCIALVGYVYLIYPLGIWLMSRVFGRLPIRPAISSHELPTMTLIISAYNEADVIQERIRNALDTDYPPEKFTILIASDGSSDGTDEIVLNCTDPRVRLLSCGFRRGKAAVLNDVVPCAQGEILLFSDANTHLEPDTARKLAAWFVRPEVGVACGRLVLVDPVNGKNVDGMYWKYETFIKKAEARLGGLIGSNGGVYAMRKSAFQPIPDNTIVDDLVIPLLARQETGCRIVYDKSAVATEETPPTIGAEFQRRARIGAGGFQAIGILYKLLLPKHGWLAFTFFNHKVLRWSCPFLLLGAMLGNVLLVLLCMPHLGSQRYLPWAALLLATQVGFYASSLISGLLPNRPKFLRIFRLSAMFTTMNLALALGFYRWFRGRQRAAWDRTQRSGRLGVSPQVGPQKTAETTEMQPLSSIRDTPNIDDSRELELSGFGKPKP